MSSDKSRGKPAATTRAPLPQERALDNFARELDRTAARAIMKSEGAYNPIYLRELKIMKERAEKAIDFAIDGMLEDMIAANARTGALLLRRKTYLESEPEGQGEIHKIYYLLGVKKVLLNEGYAIAEREKSKAVCLLMQLMFSNIEAIVKERADVKSMGPQEFIYELNSCIDPQFQEIKEKFSKKDYEAILRSLEENDKKMLIDRAAAIAKEYCESHGLDCGKVLEDLPKMLILY